MSTERLKSRVRRYAPAKTQEDIRCLGRARLPGWHFTLDLFAARQGCLVADICEGSPEDEVWGVVYKLDREFVVRSDGKRSVLDRIEGHRPERDPENYRLCTTRVELGKALVSAFTYIGTDDARRRCRENHPDAQIKGEYKEAVLAGAAIADLPPDYQTFLREALDAASHGPPTCSTASSEGSDR